MGAAIGQSLAIAVGILISPMPLVALVLMLVSRNAKANGTAFVVGWVGGIVILTALVAALVGTSTHTDTGAATWVGWVKIVIGLLLLVLGVHSWRGRPAAGEVTPAPKWMAAIDEFSPLKAAGLAVLLGTINPKNLLLAVSGGVAIASATVSTGQQVGAAVVFALVASLGMLTLFGIYLVMGERAGALLKSIKQWMIANNTVIMTVLLLVLGAKVLGDGVAIV